MKTLLRAGAMSLALSIAAAAGYVTAQATLLVGAPGSFAPVQSVGFGSVGGLFTAVDSTHPLPVSNVVPTTTVDRGAIVGTTAVTLMPANPARRGFWVQNQSATATCYLNGSATATADYHSLLIPAGGYFEPDHHVGTGPLSYVCTGAGTSTAAREW